MVWNFYFYSVWVEVYQKNGIYPQNCKILKYIYFTIPIEEEDANFELSAHEPNI